MFPDYLPVYFCNLMRIGYVWKRGMYMHALTSNIYSQQGITNIRTELILTFARMAIADTNLVAQLVSASAASRECSEESLWKGLLEQWWRRVSSHIDNVAPLYLMFSV
jgi:hypothetical protein